MCANCKLQLLRKYYANLTKYTDKLSVEKRHGGVEDGSYMSQKVV